MDPLPLDSWMAAIPDTVSLGQLSLAGTHNSSAYRTSYPSVRCQNVNVTVQLAHGVRFLDLRLARSYLPLSRSSLQVVHGAFPVAASHSVSLDKELARVYAFLRSHPSETVIVSLKGEGPYGWREHDLAQLLARHYLDPAADRWFREPRIPALGECRGRAVLLRRFDAPPALHARSGFPATDWPYNTAGEPAGGPSLLCVQDYCEVNTPAHVQRKIEYVVAHIDRAGAHAGPDAYFLNFTTGANFWNMRCWPRDIAASISPAIKARMEATPGRCGILVMDFADQDDWWLVRNIVARNVAPRPSSVPSLAPASLSSASLSSASTAADGDGDQENPARGLELELPLELPTP
ncbi:PLC-like phosphodiesterase [Dipodascopsis tothii]|uniref:PLC-like phosphodiesterase n=1 Tax=Dipodascopsis tothii TaxID=44089 RepID=UPI0034CD8C83